MISGMKMKTIRNGYSAFFITLPREIMLVRAIVVRMVLAEAAVMKRIQFQAQLLDRLVIG
jgi:hypothetical protein